MCNDINLFSLESEYLEDPLEVLQSSKSITDFYMTSNIFTKQSFSNGEKTTTTQPLGFFCLSIRRHGLGG